MNKIWNKIMKREKGLPTLDEETRKKLLEIMPPVKKPKEEIGSETEVAVSVPGLLKRFNYEGHIPEYEIKADKQLSSDVRDVLQSLNSLVGELNFRGYETKLTESEKEFTDGRIIHNYNIEIYKKVKL
jgi:hypothetical protein